MSKLSIEERVDILLREGVDKPKKWAAVHGYEEPDPKKINDAGTWHDEWYRLRSHHLEETNFLFNVIRELVKRINK